MRRVAIFLLLVLIAVLLAGAYGVIHNQISYSVSPEYFTKFKFRQFGFVDLPLPDRTKASLVGILASWWMGIPIGLLAGASGFIYSEPRVMFRQTLKAFSVLIVFVLLIGVFGLLYGFMRTKQMNLADYQHWFIPDDIVNLRRFVCAGYMHNSSYLGGLLGIGAAWVYQLRCKRRLRSDMI